MTTQVSLSLELLCLLNWLLKNEQPQLHALVKHAIEHGFIEDLNRYENMDPQDVPDELFNTFIDYLDFLEQTLIKQLESVNIDTKTKDAILPALQKLETRNLDFKTIWLSMQQTRAKVAKSLVKHSPAKPTTLNQEQKADDILFERLLKNWKPGSKETLN